MREPVYRACSNVPQLLKEILDQRNQFLPLKADLTTRYRRPFCRGNLRNRSLRQFFLGSYTLAVRLSKLQPRDIQGCAPGTNETFDLKNQSRLRQFFNLKRSRARKETNNSEITIKTTTTTTSESKDNKLKSKDNNNNKHPKTRNRRLDGDN